MPDQYGCLILSGSDHSSVISQVKGNDPEGFHILKNAHKKPSGNCGCSVCSFSAGPMLRAYCVFRSLGH